LIYDAIILRALSAENARERVSDNALISATRAA